MYLDVIFPHNAFKYIIICIRTDEDLMMFHQFGEHFLHLRICFTLECSRKQGIRMVLAHVDRYPADLIEGLFDMGLMGQLNADSLHKLFKPKHLLRWIDEGSIVALGSDLHGCDPKSYVPFSKTVSGMAERMERVMTATAALVKDAKKY